MKYNSTPMAIAEVRNLNILLIDILSIFRFLFFIKTVNNRIQFIQEALTSAMAIPLAFSKGNRLKAKVTFIITAMVEKIKGVFVSCLAK